MNEFEKAVTANTCSDLLMSEGIDVIQVDIGLRCNQRCSHCHIEASPDRTEMMYPEAMAKVAEIVAVTRCRMVDITGGAPEMHPQLKLFVSAVRETGVSVQVRTNLSILVEDGYRDFPAFYRDNGVGLVGSLPCCTEENVRKQRGDGAFEKSIEALRRLNALGYGHDPALPLNLVYNPGGPFLPASQKVLEADYRRVLHDQYGVSFTHLLTITNMPIGRFAQILEADGASDAYTQLLRQSFNPETLPHIMCRRQISVGWDGTLYDCDFNLALGLPMNHGAPGHISDFDVSRVAVRGIVTGDHCFGCTAGSGSSCDGTLT